MGFQHVAKQAGLAALQQASFVFQQPRRTLNPAAGEPPPPSRPPPGGAKNKHVFCVLCSCASKQNAKLHRTNDGHPSLPLFYITRDCPPCLFLCHKGLASLPFLNTSKPFYSGSRRTRPAASHRQTRTPSPTRLSQLVHSQRHKTWFLRAQVSPWSPSRGDRSGSRCARCKTPATAGGRTDCSLELAGGSGCAHVVCVVAMSKYELVHIRA